jgi:UDP-3-O-[3-hydroxymyristoyl] glucosamine N-acyltransferase
MRTLKEIAEAVGGRVLGDGTVRLQGVSSFHGARGEHLVFAQDEERLSEAVQSGAGAVLTGEFAKPAKTDKPLLVARNPRLAFARAAALLAGPGSHAPGVHPTAVVDATAKLGAEVAVGPGAVIGAGVVVGEKSILGPNVTIAPGVRIGAECTLHAGVTVYGGTTLGRRVMVHAGAVLGSDGFGFVPDPETGRYEKFPQVGTLEIHDDAEIGANTTIDRGALEATVIGRGVKLDNLVHVGHNVRIGENVVIAAQTGISGSVVIEPGAIIAGQVGIADHVRVEGGVILGAQSGVPSNKVVRGKGVVFWGTPARPIRQYLKELAVLARLAKKKDKGG